MTAATLSLSCSRKIYELLGDAYGTSRHWDPEFGRLCRCGDGPEEFRHLTAVPAPNFSETIRLLPKIAEKKGWIYWVEEKNELENLEKLAEVTQGICWQYTKTKTEEEGMAKVSEYLENALTR